VERTLLSAVFDLSLTLILSLIPVAAIFLFCSPENKFSLRLAGESDFSGFGAG
jgi:hypothetical protein